MVTKAGGSVSISIISTYRQKSKNVKKTMHHSQPDKTAVQLQKINVKILKIRQFKANKMFEAARVCRVQ